MQYVHQSHSLTSSIKAFMMAPLTANLSRSDLSREVFDRLEGDWGMLYVEREYPNRVLGPLTCVKKVRHGDNLAIYSIETPSEIPLPTGFEPYLTRFGDSRWMIALCSSMNKDDEQDLCAWLSSVDINRAVRPLLDNFTPGHRHRCIHACWILDVDPHDGTTVAPGATLGSVPFSVSASFPPESGTLEFWYQGLLGGDRFGLTYRPSLPEEKFEMIFSRRDPDSFIDGNVAVHD